MLSEEQKKSIQDSVLNEIFSNFDMDKYSDKLVYETAIEIMKNDGWSNEVDYVIYIPEDILIDTCLAAIECWLDDGYVDYLINAVPEDNVEAYKQSIRDIFMKMVDMWMYDNPPSSSESTYEDFAFDFSQFNYEEYGEPASYSSRYDDGYDRYED